MSTSYLLTPMIEEMARQMDRDTAAAICRNFLRLTFGLHPAYITENLKTIIEREPDLHKKGLDELLCYMIDFLPLEGRNDLSEAKQVFNNSPVLQQFVKDQRQHLGEVMGVDDIYEHANIAEVDDTKVDIQLALGFGDNRCIQADFLIPAMMAMASEGLYFFLRLGDGNYHVSDLDCTINWVFAVASGYLVLWTDFTLP